MLLAEMFTAAQLAQGGVTSQQIAQATARLSENARDPKVAEAIRHRQDASAKLSELYRKRDELAEAQRQGATCAERADRRRPRQADQRRAGRAGGCRCGAAGGLAELRPARAAGGAGEGRVRRAASGRGVRRHHAQRRRRLGVPAAQRHASRCPRSMPALKQVAELVRRVRAGIELTTSGLPTFDIADAQKLYQLTLGGVARLAGGREGAGRGARGPAAVAAVRGAADRAGRARRSRRRAVAGAQVHPRPRAGAVQLRLAAQDRGRLARDAARGSASATSIR